MPKIHHVIGGGTISHIRSHLALAAPAYGTTAREIHEILQESGETSQLHLTRMADPNSQLETNEDIAALVERLKADPNTGIIFFNPALVDFDGQIGGVPSGKYADRLRSRESEGEQIALKTADKVVGSIRKERKDIFLVAFKTTAGADEDEQYERGLELLKDSHINLVLANDVKTRKNMIIAPEETRYDVTTDRKSVIRNLVDMAIKRSRLHFTHSKVVDGPRVSWESQDVPDNLRQVVNHCIKRGAYKPFKGKTAGHFAARGKKKGEILTSARKENFNELAKRGLVRVETKGKDNVIAYGAKPSVGGQSQRIIFERFPDADCIVHFHCPTKENAPINTRDQRPYECGSHECGENTANGLREHEDGIHAVMLDNHGPNIVFNRNTPPEKVIAFIERNFDLEQKTGGVFKYAPSAS